MKTSIYLGILFLIFSPLLFAQTRPLEIKDANGDGMYDIDEFSNVYSKGYNDWDVDADGKINQDEFFNNNYNQLDINHDGRLTNEEWTSGNRYYGKYVPADKYSKNPPQYLSREEFAKRFSETDYYKSYDSDNNGFIDNNELNGATFNRLDQNHDGKLDKTELEGY